MHSKGTVIDNRFKIRKKLGEGSFGSVFKAKDMYTKQYVALKIDSRIRSQIQLINEIHAYETLSSIEGIPKLAASGRLNDSIYLAIEILGKTLSHRLKEKPNFSLGCVINISLDLLKRLQDIHESCYIHRDIKPSNIMTGKNKSKKLLYLIDFGLAKKYRDPATKQHSIYGEDRQMIGNLKYTSLNSHMGIEQSRRDDLESWMYLAINMILGRLPWDTEKNINASYGIMKMKSSLSFDQICEGCPQEFSEIFKYIRSLHFEERPNYDFIRTSIQSIISKYSLTLNFDWLIRNPRRLSNGHLHVRKPKEIRRGSENLDPSKLQFITNGINISADISGSNSNISSSSAGSEFGFQTEKTPEHSPQSTRGINGTTFSKLATYVSKDESMKEESEKDEDSSEKHFEREETLKHIYPEFHKKRIHFKVNLD